MRSRLGGFGVKLSVIIATCNRPASLGRLVQSLAVQMRPREHELLIAENGSSERSPLPSLPVPIVHIYDRLPGKCRVQNRAIKESTGEILVFLDDDLVVAAGYLDEVERFFQEHPEFAAMKGRILAAEDPAARLGSAAVYLDLPIVDHGETVIEAHGVIGANMAFRASALEAVGLFDDRLGPGAAGHEEETEMSARLRRNGFRIGYAPRAIVHHEVDPARADRARFIRIARERGRCRVIHEQHRIGRVRIDLAIARVRLRVATLFGAPPERAAREEKRVAILRGMLDGLREEAAAASPATSGSS